MLSNEMKVFIQSISFNELFQAMDKEDRKIIIESIQDIQNNLSDDDKKTMKEFLELMNKNKYSIIIGSIIKNNKHVLKSMLERAKETLPLEKFNILSPHLVAESGQQLSKMFARKTGLKSIELSDEDKKDLENALIPVQDKLDSIIQYLPYVPLILFSLAYVLRVFGEYKQKKKEEKQKQENNQIDQSFTVPNNPISQVNVPQSNIEIDQSVS